MDNDNYKSTSPTAQLGGARRKNGHKVNCTCHICENMKNKAKRGGYQDDEEKKIMKMNGGSKKKNGHKMNCSCPICKNMKNKTKRGGDGDEEADYMEEDQEKESDFEGGRRSKKLNGHKANCKCPICKNMRKSKKGGEEPDIEEGMENNINESGALNKIESNKIEASETEANPEEYDELVAAEEGKLPPLGPDRVGGTRKRRGSNGHKTTCKCPICKNMRKGKKTRRHKRRSHRRR